ncbi:hypothetical protein K7X08_001814 [Anisodus acutangulus]|uniref:Uncharacterized protein n=1 Tax=Anisodus acutangulus TaxID=402998 RepID=A0A9Q1LS81_9SOLA|nr:hypothetical protein K7X08_001814 [Anisodus acutangulus]
MEEAPYDLFLRKKLMGKKKVVKKTKELSVAIAESSAMSGDSQQQKQQITPRKRGRPRKIIIKDEDVSAELKKLKTSEVEESENKQGEKKKEEEEKLLEPQKQQPTRSRARRKSKPRKSC